MREILRAARDRESDVVAWLEVIEQFDHAVAAQASIEELVRLAGDITGTTVGVRDEWSSVELEVQDGVLRTGAPSGVADAAAERGVRHRGAVALDTPRGPALVAPIEVAAGRVGFAWLLSAGAPWEPGQHLVVERLAGAVAARTLEARKQRPGGFDPAAVERLLSGELSEAELARGARQARLGLNDRYVALACCSAVGLALETTAEIVQDAIAERRIAARGAVIGRHAAVVARASSSLSRALEELTNVHIGVGDAHDLAELPASWEHAKEALALRHLVGTPAYFDRLGVLHLLAQIPREHVLASDVLQRLTGAIDPGHPSDVEVLEAYLEEGTLRRAGTRVFLHHTTVQHRLKGIEQRLGVDLQDPASRFQVQLAVKLLGIARADDVA